MTVFSVQAFSPKVPNPFVTSSPGLALSSTLALALALALGAALLALDPAQAQGVPAAAATAAEAPANTPAEAGQAGLPAIRVAPVTRQTLRERVIASGLVAPIETVEIQPQIEGQAIEELLADIGDMVQAGAPLARLSPASLTLQKGQLIAARAQAEAAIAQAEAQRIEAEAAAREAARVRQRTQNLSRQGTASQAALDQAIATDEAAQARVAAAAQGLRAAQAQRDLVDAQIADVELNLNRTLVTAPVAGLVVGRQAVLGAIASGQGQPMFTLIRAGALELRADLAEADVLRLAPGQTARLRVAGQAQPITGLVRLVEPMVDTQTRLGRVRITLDRPDLLRAGMFAEAEILIAETEALAVPVSAISGNATAGRAAAGADAPPEAFVLRVTADGRVERSPVRLGIRDAGLVEIREGLFGGEWVVARAGAFLRPGERIVPIPPEPDPSGARPETRPETRPEMPPEMPAPAPGSSAP